jgi:hypothetical protein
MSVKNGYVFSFPCCFHLAPASRCLHFGWKWVEKGVVEQAFLSFTAKASESLAFEAFWTVFESVVRIQPPNEYLPCAFVSSRHMLSQSHSTCFISHRRWVLYWCRFHAEEVANLSPKLPPMFRLDCCAGDGANIVWLDRYMLTSLGHIGHAFPMLRLYSLYFLNPERLMADASNLLAGSTIQPT